MCSVCSQNRHRPTTSPTTRSSGSPPARNENRGNVAELTGASLFPGAELSRVSRLLYVNLSARAETETWTPLWGHDSVPGTRDGKPGPESDSRSLVDRLARAAAHANAL